MNKSEKTILLKEHLQIVKEHVKVIEKKDALITELANIVDEFHTILHDYGLDLAAVMERAKKATNKKAVKDVAWPPRKRVGE